MNDSPLSAPQIDAQRRCDIVCSEIPEGPYRRVLHVGCGDGRLTCALPGQYVVGVSASAPALGHDRAPSHVHFEQASLLHLERTLEPAFDLIVVSDVLDAPPLSNALPLFYMKVEQLLATEGVLVSVHAEASYGARFPYLLLRHHLFEVGGATHRLEVYAK